jgi:hypothetical protein
MSEPESPDGWKPMFDLSQAKGVNESERVLTELCKRSFLRLWAQTNVFTDEGFKAGRGSAKELCDALVVFGKHVLIFSDKHIKFQDDKALDVAWPRWYRRAVVESIRQLHGARNWLERFPQRAFLDAACARPLPVKVPSGPDVTYHLIAVTRGSKEAAIRFAGGQGRGTFGVDTDLTGETHHTAPFTMGRPLPEKPFVHIFDEVSIELVLRELDTAPDFIQYLQKRQQFLSGNTHVVAAGEEDLLAAYLQYMDAAGEQHQFLPSEADGDHPDVVLYDHSFYDELEKKQPYRLKKEADKVSYAWDMLVDRFITVGDPNLHGTGLVQTAAGVEEGLRLLAGETRFRRRNLAQLLIEGLSNIEPNQRLARLGYSGVAEDAVYVFLIVPKRPEEDYDSYRSHRLALLHAYCRTAKLKAPLGSVFVGLAFDNPRQGYQGGSEDLFVYSQEEWTAEELAELEQMRNDLRLWGAEMRMRFVRADEFPAMPPQWPVSDGEDVQSVDASERGRSRSDRTKKRREKMKKASQRKNRK